MAARFSWGVIAHICLLRAERSYDLSQAYLEKQRIWQRRYRAAVMREINVVHESASEARM